VSDLYSLDYALALSRLGLSIIPVPRPGPKSDGKQPSIAWKQYQTERPTEEQLRAWFATEQNLAVITGAISGVVVVDTDAASAEEWARLRLPRTPWRVRTAKGWHRYYRHPGVEVRNQARIEAGQGHLALDVRGDGGLAIGPGSIHASGMAYSAVGDWSVPAEKLPAFWLGWLRPKPKLDPKPRTPRSGGDPGPDDRLRRARAYLFAIPRPVIGEGSDNATFRAACRLVRGFCLDPGAAIDLLLEWSGFDRSWLEEKVTSAVKYGEEPEGGLLEG
jgi:hypothetical protein